MTKDVICLSIFNSVSDSFTAHFLRKYRYFFKKSVVLKAAVPEKTFLRSQMRLSFDELSLIQDFFWNEWPNFANCKHPKLIDSLLLDSGDCFWEKNSVVTVCLLFRWREAASGHRPVHVEEPAHLALRRGHLFSRHSHRTGSIPSLFQ